MTEDKSRIVLICGKQGSGKSTLQRALLDALDGAVAGKFAAPLYELADLVYTHLREKYGLALSSGDPAFKRLLQVMGVEWGREQISQNIWVDCAKNYAASMPDKVFVFDDCRFENEFRAFPGAIKVRLVADESVRKGRADRWREQTDHPSETGLDHISDAEFDLVYKTEGNENVSTTMMVSHIKKLLAQLR